MRVEVMRLRNIAVAAREIMESISRTSADSMFDGFPRGTCGPTAELLARYLNEAIGLDAQYVGADRSDGWSHAWLLVNGTIIVDITADQFGEEPVIVSYRSPWHEAWERDEPRPPICDEAQWPAYPFATWKALVEGMVARGF